MIILILKSVRNRKLLNCKEGSRSKILQWSDIYLCPLININNYKGVAFYYTLADHF